MIRSLLLVVGLSVSAHAGIVSGGMGAGGSGGATGATGASVTGATGATGAAGTAATGAVDYTGPTIGYMPAVGATGPTTLINSPLYSTGATGNVGLATTNPTARLQVENVANTGAETTVFSVANSTAYITSRGKVWQGTPQTAPTGNFRGFVVGARDADLVNDLFLGYKYSDTYQGGMYSNSGTLNSLSIFAKNPTGTFINFLTGATPTEKVRITTDGNVGIGTTNPGSLLTVSADTFTVTSVGIVTAPSQSGARVGSLSPSGYALANGAETALFWTNETWDRNNSFIATSSDTIKARGAGLYFVDVSLACPNTGAATHTARVWVKVNGTTKINQYGTQTQSLTNYHRASGFLTLADGDSVTVTVYNDGSSPLIPTADDTTTFFSLQKIW